MYLNYYIYMIMFIISLVMLTFFYKHILLTLMSLEFMMLSSLMLMGSIMYIMNNIYYILFYLVFVVCEGVLGLTLLILIIRNKGNDNMKFLNLILW